MNLTGRLLANRYEIIEEIGSGGMAVVYKAKDSLLNRYIAVKVLRDDLKNDSEFVRRFNIEAQAAASLTHPNIVSIYDVGNEDGLHYIVMEYVEGETLKEYIDEKHVLPWRESVDYAIQIGRGLEQAHKNSIVHRDVKPHNIIMTADGVLKVTDFGIARASVQATMTCEDSAIGSVHYISPEQARGGYTDERSDIYSLGIVLYEMLTGIVPFDNESPVTIAIKHLQEEPVPPREHNLSIPLPLEKIVLKAIAKELSLRYKNVSELIDDLQAVLNDPSREIGKTGEPEIYMGETRIMKSVQESDVESYREEEEKNVGKKRATEKKKAPVQIDKNKEKKVIIWAIVSAIAVILIIAFAFISITGIGGLFLGTDDMVVPKLEGMLYEEAVEKYKDQFSIVKGSEIESDEEEGTILTQDIESGSKIKKGSEVVITVDISTGSEEIVLENYTRYKDSKEVRREMENLGLRARFIEEYSDTIPKDSIISQDPSAGNTVKKGETIIFYVSRGPEEDEDDKKDDDKTNENNNKNDNQSSSGSSGNTATGGTSGESTGNGNAQGNTGSGSESAGGSSEPEKPKKTSMITIFGPKDKDSALVQVKVNGAEIYSATLKRDESKVVQLTGTSSSVQVEILYDGVVKQSGTATLY